MPHQTSAVTSGRAQTVSSPGENPPSTHKMPEPARMGSGKYETILVPVSITEQLEQTFSKTFLSADEISRLRNYARSEEAPQSLQYWNDGTCIRWNEIARDLGCESRMQAPEIARACALVSTAQHDAVIAARGVQAENTPPVPEPTGTPPVFAASALERSCIATASADVIAFLFPRKSKQIQTWLEEHNRCLFLTDFKKYQEVLTGKALGHLVATYFIAYAQNDGSSVPWRESAPHGKQFWHGNRPVLPGWGKVKTWLVQAPTSLCPPPPKWGTPAFHAAVQEVLNIAEKRTPDQFRLAHRWGDGVGTYTPPGRWNAIACDELLHGANTTFRTEAKAARLLAFLNMGLMDTGVYCWKTKYTYWVPRPSHVDRRIVPAMKLPEFPSYVSGHASFSSTAAVILSHFLPERAAHFHSMAAEASLSRLLGSIHYRFDCDGGMCLGKNVAQIVLDKVKAIE